jgi:hypothetical protein
MPCRKSSHGPPGRSPIMLWLPCSSPRIMGSLLRLNRNTHLRLAAVLTCSVLWSPHDQSCDFILSWQSVYFIHDSTQSAVIFHCCLGSKPLAVLVHFVSSHSISLSPTAVGYYWCLLSSCYLPDVRLPHGIHSDFQVSAGLPRVGGIHLSLVSV